jgi:L-alanine-DL-glutamate epimerase-like enolase superfamily enzyme
MRITGVQTEVLRIPEDDPLADMPEEAGRTRSVVILRMRTDAGIEGIGLTFYGGATTGALRTAVDWRAEARRQRADVGRTSRHPWARRIDLAQANREALHRMSDMLATQPPLPCLPPAR